MKTVLVDIYGADIGPTPIIKGALSALDIFPDLKLCFIGDEAVITPILDKDNIDKSRVEILHTTDFVTNDESPVSVLKGRENSSLVMGIERLKNDSQTIGFLSSGNTGALLIASIFRLGLVAGLKSPSLCSVIPCCDGKMLAIADCGANIESKSDDLVNYALMGNALMKCLGYSDSPKIGLLSVGREEAKGNKLTLEAFEKLSKLPINFVGNIEGLDVVSGELDVIVADGFSGNVLLKTIESVGKSAIYAVEDALKDCDEALKPDLLKLKNRLSVAYDFNPYGGATFLGTQKPVIKMHGSATEITPRSCIEQLFKMENAGYRTALISALENR